MAVGEIYLKTYDVDKLFFRDASDIERSIKGSLYDAKWTSGISVVPTAVSDGHIVMGHFYTHLFRPVCLAFRSSGSWYYLSADFILFTGVPSGQIRLATPASVSRIELEWDGWKILRTV